MKTFFLLTTAAAYVSLVLSRLKTVHLIKDLNALPLRQ
jgi:hypothetical protein